MKKLYKLSECYLPKHKQASDNINECLLLENVDFNEDELVSFDDARKELYAHVEKLRKLYGGLK